jgi:hypothetical protein
MDWQRKENTMTMEKDKEVFCVACLCFTSEQNTSVSDPLPYFVYFIT